MPNYVHKNLVKYRHKKQKSAQHCPYKPASPKYGKEATLATDEEESPTVDNEKKKYVQQVLASFLFYMRAVDLTILHALNAIAAKQAHPTERTIK